MTGAAAVTAPVPRCDGVRRVDRAFALRTAPSAAAAPVDRTVRAGAARGRGAFVAARIRARSVDRRALVRRADVSAHQDRQERGVRRRAPRSDAFAAIVAPRPRRVCATSPGRRARASMRARRRGPRPAVRAVQRDDDDVSPRAAVAHASLRGLLTTTSGRCASDVAGGRARRARVRRPGARRRSRPRADCRHRERRRAADRVAAPARPRSDRRR